MKKKEIGKTFSIFIFYICSVSFFISCSAEHYYNKGWEYYEAKDYENAIKNYTKAIQLDSTYYLAYTDRGFIYYLQEKFDEAIIDFDRSLRLNPESYALRWRGSAYYSRGLNKNDIEDFKTAIADLETVFKTFPNYSRKDEIESTLSSARIELRSRERKMGKMNLVPGTRAEEHYQRGLAYAKEMLDEKYKYMDEASKAIISFFSFTGDLNKAIPEWEAALRLDPNHYEAKRDLEEARRQRDY